MKKRDIINIVKEITKEMRGGHEHDGYGAGHEGGKNSISGLPGIWEGDALIDSGIEAYKKINKISPNNSLKGAYARELKTILGNNDINGYEFENIKVDDEGTPIDLSSEQAIALTRVAKDVRAPFTIEDNPEMYRENKNMKQKTIKEYGDTITSSETELAQLVTDKGKIINIPVSGPEELKSLKNLKNVKNVSIPKENLDLTNDVGKDDYVDDEGRFAKSQLYKMGKYAEKLHNMLDDMEQLPAWVQSKLTKASDYVSMIYHYLDYEFARQENNLMEHLDNHKKQAKRAVLMEGAMKKFFEAFDRGMTDEEIIQDYASKGTQVPEAFVANARRQYESYKKLKLELDMSEKEFKNSSTKIVNNAEEGMEPVEGKQLASGLFKEEPNEGNAFAVARLKAIKAGEKNFKLGDKEFDVTDVSDDDKKAAEEV